jgi:hypothetical protein
VLSLKRCVVFSFKKYIRYIGKKRFLFFFLVQDQDKKNVDSQIYRVFAKYIIRSIHLLCTKSRNVYPSNDSLCGYKCIYPLVEQELLILSEHLSSPRFLGGSYYSIFSFMCMLCRSLFALFLLAIALFVLLRLWYLQTRLILCLYNKALKHTSPDV